MNQLESRNQTICTFEPSFKVIMLVLLGTTSVAAFIENVFFCTAVYFNKKLHSKSNILIINLAITDIIISAILPNLEFVYVYFYPSWPIGSLGTKFLNLIWIFSLVCPFVTMTAITFERFVVIAGKPSWKYLITKKMYLLVVIFIWAYSFLCCFVTAVSMLPAPRYNYVWNVNPTLYYVFLGVHIIFPLVLFPGLYYKMQKVSVTSMKEISKEVGEIRQEREMKLSKTIVIIIGVLYMVWTPVVVLEILYNHKFKNCVVSKMEIVSAWLTCFNGCLNPLLYSYRNAEVKKFILSLVHVFRKKKNYLDDYRKCEGFNLCFKFFSYFFHFCLVYLDLSCLLRIRSIKIK